MPINLSSYTTLGTCESTSRSESATDIRRVTRPTQLGLNPSHLGSRSTPRLMSGETETKIEGGLQSEIPILNATVGGQAPPLHRWHKYPSKALREQQDRICQPPKLCSARSMPWFSKRSSLLQMSVPVAYRLCKWHVCTVAHLQQSSSPFMTC